MAGKVKVSLKARLGDEVIILVKGEFIEREGDTLVLRGVAGDDEVYVDNIVGVISV